MPYDLHWFRGVRGGCSLLVGILLGREIVIAEITALQQSEKKKSIKVENDESFFEKVV